MSETKEPTITLTALRILLQPTWGAAVSEVAEDHPEFVALLNEFSRSAERKRVIEECAKIAAGLCGCGPEFRPNPCNAETIAEAIRRLVNKEPGE